MKGQERRDPFVLRKLHGAWITPGSDDEPLRPLQNSAEEEVMEERAFRLSHTTDSASESTLLGNNMAQTTLFGKQSWGGGRRRLLLGGKEVYFVGLSVPEWSPRQDSVPPRVALFI